jgi:hypothetical protein
MEATAISKSDQREFEFDGAQNVLIQGLAGGMRFVGTFNVVIGIMEAAFVGLATIVALFSRNFVALAPFVLYGLFAAYFLTIGIWLRHAAGSFMQVVTSEGRDITNLMSALAELSKFFRFWRGLIIAFLCLGALVMIGTIALAVLGMLAAAHGGP